MSNFDNALKYTLQNEGGFSNDPSDKGGATNLGIQQTEWNDWLKENGKMYPISLAEFKALTPEDVAPLYLKDYWNALRLSQVDHPVLATSIFDMGVNFGPNTSGKLTQRALNTLGCDLNIDGWLGPITLSELNYAPVGAFMTAFMSLCRTRYNNIVADDPTQGVFLRGWLARVNRLSSLS